MAIAGTQRHRWRTTALLAASATLLFACSGDSESPLSSLAPEPAPEEPAPEEPAPEEPAPEEPAPEEPAPEEPAPEEPAPEDTEGEPLTTEEWVVVILLGILALAAVAGIAALLSRRPKGQTDVASRQMRLDDITRSCRSAHDSSVLSILQTSDPAALRNGWTAAQHQLVDLETRISYLAAELSDATSARTLQELGTAVTAVRGALESNVGLRLDGSGTAQADVIEASNRTVLSRNDQLESALQRALYLRL